MVRPLRCLLLVCYQLGQIGDELFFLEAQHVALTEFSTDIQRRVTAAQAFTQASDSQSVRTTLLARSRPVTRDRTCGECCYYWREHGGPALKTCHWQGPTVVAKIQPKIDDDTTKQRSLWVVHGSSLFFVLFISSFGNSSQRHDPVVKCFNHIWTQDRRTR